MASTLRVLRTMHVPYLCFTLHSSSLLPGGSPYAPDRAAVERVFYTVSSTLARLATDAGLAPETVADIAHRLEAERHARDRDQPAG